MAFLGGMNSSSKSVKYYNGSMANIKLFIEESNYADTIEKVQEKSVDLNGQLTQIITLTDAFIVHVNTKMKEEYNGKKMNVNTDKDSVKPRMALTSTLYSKFFRVIESLDKLIKIDKSFTSYKIRIENLKVKLEETFEKLSNYLSNPEDTELYLKHFKNYKNNKEKIGGRRTIIKVKHRKRTLRHKTRRSKKLRRYAS
jgi:hypothetical protein